MFASSCPGSKFYIVWLRALCHFYFGFHGERGYVKIKVVSGGEGVKVRGGVTRSRVGVGFWVAAAFVSSSSTHSCQIYFSSRFFLLCILV